MEPSEYNDLVAFLQSQTENEGKYLIYPTSVCTSTDKANFRKKANKFALKHGILFRRVQVKKRACPTIVKLVRVARAVELPTILEQFHGEKMALHKGRDVILAKIKGEYWFV
jgi:hypothetical protein